MSTPRYAWKDELDDLEERTKQKAKEQDGCLTSLGIMVVLLALTIVFLGLQVISARG